MGGKTQQASSQVTIPPEVLARYNSVNAQAQQTAATPFQQYSSDPNAFVSPLTTAQNMGLQQTANYANAAQPGIQGAMDMTAGASGQANPWELTGDKINQYMNPYTQNVTSQMGALMNQQAQTAQSGQLGNAIKSGAFGGDRAGVAAANLQGQNALAYGNAMAPVLQQGYNTGLQTAIGQQGVDLGAQQQNLQRMMTGANQYGQLAGMGQQAGLAGAQAMMGAGQVQQQTQQAGLTALYNQFQQQQSYPFQVNQFLANIAEGTGSLSGQTTNTTQQAPFFSDRRLKENIKQIGTAKNGLPIHSFNYKDDPAKLTRLGFMADEVEKKHPEAVGLAGGYKTVDHEQAMKSGGGSVTDFDQGRAYDRGGYSFGGDTYDPSWQSVGQRHMAGLQSPQQGSSLYGSKRRHVPEASGGRYSLPTAPTVPGARPTGLSQAVGTAQATVGLGQSLGDAYTKYTGGDKDKPAATTNAPAAGGAPAVVAKAPDGTPLPADITNLSRGGLALGGEPVITAAPAAVMPAHAAASMAGQPAEGVPDVVAPTTAYQEGLGKAQFAQENANRIQDEARAEAKTSPISFKPDWDYPGLGATDLQRSAKVYGANTLNGYYDPTHGGSYLGFERGGFAGGGEGSQGGQGGNADVLKTPDPNATQDITQMDIPDKASPFKLPPPPSTGGGKGKSGASQALGGIKQLAGLASMIPGVGAVTGPLGAIAGAGEALAGAAGGLMVAGGRRRKGKRKGLAAGGQGEGVDYMSRNRQIDPEIAKIADSWADPSDTTGNQGAGVDYMGHQERVAPEAPEPPSETREQTGTDYMSHTRQLAGPRFTKALNSAIDPDAANTGLGGKGYDYMSEAQQGREPELKSSVHPAMSVSNATPEEQAAYLKQHIPREDMHKVMPPAVLAREYPPTEAPARGEMTPEWKPADVVIPTPGGGESPLATDLGGASRPLQHGAEPIADVDAGGAPTVGLAAGESGSGFAEKPFLGSRELRPAGLAVSNATPGEAAAALAEANSPEGRAHTQIELAKRVAALQATREARESEEYGNKSLARKVGEATGMIAPTRGLVPDAEKEAAARLNAPVSPLDNDPATRVGGPNVTEIPSNTNKIPAPPLMEGAKPDPNAAAAKVEEPAPGLAAAAQAPVAAQAPATADDPRVAMPPGTNVGGPLAGLAPREFPMAASPLGGVAQPVAPAPVAKPATAPLPPRRPSPGVVAPAGGAARAPTPPNDANGNPIEQFFGGIARGIDGALHNVADFFTGGARNVGNTINSAGQVMNKAGQAIGQTVNSAGQAIGNEVHGRFNELMNGSPKMMSPGGKFNAQGVDQRLISNLTEATRGLPQGWHAQFESGFRQNDKRQHGRGAAVDVALYNEKGERLANYQDPTTFRAYEKFAQDFRAAQQHNNPELNSATRWGGYFSGKAVQPGQKYDAEHPYGAVDLMHFDLGGRQGLGMLGGSWEGGMTAKQHGLFPGAVSVGMGQRPPEGYPTAVATSSDGTRTTATGAIEPGYHNGVQGILAQEEQFRNKAYWDANASGSGGHWAVGYGSHKMQDPQTGQMREVREGDATTPQAAQQVMTDRLRNEYLPAAVKKAGGLDTWRALPRNVRDGLGSTIWNYGHLPDPVAFAIRSGGGAEAIARAVESLPARTANARKRRASEAAHIRGGG